MQHPTIRTFHPAVPRMLVDKAATTAPRLYKLWVSLDSFCIVAMPYILVKDNMLQSCTPIAAVEIETPLCSSLVRHLRDIFLLAQEFKFYGYAIGAEWASFGWHVVLSTLGCDHHLHW